MSGSPPALSLLVRHFLLLVMTSSLLYAEAAADKPCGTTIHSAHRITSRIVNGNKADIYDNPWMVQVTVSVNETHRKRCGGSIINPEYVLTAQHCMFNKAKGIHYRVPDSSVRVVTGKSGWSHYNTKAVEEVFTHKDTDIAIIKLKFPLNLEQSPRENSICLPKKDVRKYDLSSLTCKTAGWGKLETNGSLSEELMEVNQNIASPTKCSAHLQRKLFRKYGPYAPLAVLSVLQKRFLCASAPNKGPCHGDSGGPLVCQNKGDNSWFVAGIVSGGSRTCALDYNVYVDVAEYLDWIDNITGETSKA